MVARKPAQSSPKQEEASSPMMAPSMFYGQASTHMDPAFVWQQLADIQRTMGAIQEGQKQIASQIDKVEAKLDKVEERVSGVTHKLYAAGVVLAIMLTIGGFIVSKAWDLMAAQLIESKK